MTTAARTQSPDVLWPEPPPLSRAKLVALLRRRLPAPVREAYLFGSYARGSATADSDVDLILVAPSQRSFSDRFRDVPDLDDGLPPIDLLIYTPTEWRRLLAHPTPLLRTAMREWVVIRSQPARASSDDDRLLAWPSLVVDSTSELG